ncbi:hypothetical protein [Thermaerobacillus caldiproteolyticus]|uniref:Uncharacterized protein n=1 Tax=Thermaerobacillus caldiproteolyticus TaxID=247480 RepID=A0A7V9Z3P0_9BACL|nr:hypothetical protein [Anoxybacillus caldiproteolyticus]MBA2873467.1 hypothetical protein [Anoxybacillus caldiproteolyticus]QPA30065.1 hypothetical protein ISX45_10385 [Anoxybacillus caldiproteolyticus]
MITRYAIPFSAELTNNSNVIDQDEEWLIATEPPSHLRTDIERLIEVENTEFTDLFNDYGFISEEGRAYIYQNAVTAFSVIDGDQTEIEMMILQLDEYLIAKEKNEKETIYFIGRHHEELLMKVAAAYNVTVHIFDLDKSIKKD